MTREEMLEVLAEAESPLGRKTVQNAMRQVQNRTMNGIGEAICRLARAIPEQDESTRPIVMPRPEDDEQVTVTLPRSDAMTLLVLAAYGRDTATKGYVRGEGLADDEQVNPIAGQGPAESQK